MIVLYFSAPEAETQQIFVNQRSLLKLGFPRPRRPEEMVLVLAIFLDTFLWGGIHFLS